MVIILEGESLVNDATALVAYRLALVAAVSGTFSLGEAALSFVVVSVGGVAIGLVAGWVIIFVLAASRTRRSRSSSRCSRRSGPGCRPRHWVSRACSRS